MRLRLVALVLLLAVIASGFTWLTLWPLLRPVWFWVLQGGPAPDPAELSVRLRGSTVPLLLLNVIGVSVLSYVVLYFTIGRPLRRTEELVEQMETLRLDFPLEQSGGPLLSRVQASLRRTADALRREQKTTAAQLDELTATNRRLAATTSELIRAEQLALVGRLAAGVAHEVGNPLMGILGYLSLLKAKQSLPDDTEQYVTRIEEEVQRIDRIVRGMLDLGRPPRATKVQLPLKAVVQSCVELVRTGKDFTGLTVELDVPESQFVFSDRAMLSQVLINLVINATQAMGGKGKLVITSERTDRTTHIHVDDEGPGLSPEVAGRLFEPFFSTKAPGQGTGLGLAVSQQLAAALGGTLTAANRPERGARFTITLPNDDTTVDGARTG